MLVKKTKSGKRSVSLTYHQRAMLEWSCSEFLADSQSGKSNDILERVYYSVINLFFIRTDFQIKLTQEKKIIMTVCEGLAIMRMLRHSQDLDLINLKAALHKSLC
jgi:hypothetical protein